MFLSCPLNYFASPLAQPQFLLLLYPLKICLPYLKMANPPNLLAASSLIFLSLPLKYFTFTSANNFVPLLTKNSTTKIFCHLIRFRKFRTNLFSLRAKIHQSHLFMNRIWCRPFADWLQTNDMIYLFRLPQSFRHQISPKNYFATGFLKINTQGCQQVLKVGGLQASDWQIRLARITFRWRR